MCEVDILIIGGGSAGMAAAAAAHEAGVKKILILERSDSLGGILCQCIHNGFGLHRYREELTGPEYAQRDIALIDGYLIPYMLRTFALRISPQKVVEAVSAEKGLFRIQAKAIILAMGCRERSRGALLIPGTRPAGVLTAGSAQRYLNLKGYLPGKQAVILGSGDIGLIMARQLTLEGVHVKEVVERMPFSNGLPRNIVQCLDDFGIPLRLSSTVIEIRGRSRVSSVVIARADEAGRTILGTQREIECDTLIIAAGLIPENELSRQANISMCPSTKGAAVDQRLQTSSEGIFSCGNVLHVHDLVDNVSCEGARAGRYAAAYVQGTVRNAGRRNCIFAEEGDGVNALVPQYIDPNTVEDRVEFQFRPKEKGRSVSVLCLADRGVIAEKRLPAITPGEMCAITVDGAALRGVKKLCVTIPRRH